MADLQIEHGETVDQLKVAVPVDTLLLKHIHRTLVLRIIRTHSGWLYLAAVIDLYARKIVG